MASPEKGRLKSVEMHPIIVICKESQFSPEWKKRRNKKGVSADFALLIYAASLCFSERVKTGLVGVESPLDIRYP